MDERESAAGKQFSVVAPLVATTAGGDDVAAVISAVPWGSGDGSDSTVRLGLDVARSVASQVSGSHVRVGFAPIPESAFLNTDQDSAQLAACVAAVAFDWDVLWIPGPYSGPIWATGAILANGGLAQDMDIISMGPRKVAAFRKGRGQLLIAPAPLANHCAMGCKALSVSEFASVSTKRSFWEQNPKVVVGIKEDEIIFAIRAVVGRIGTPQSPPAPREWPREWLRRWALLSAAALAIIGAVMFFAVEAVRNPNRHGLPTSNSRGEMTRLRMAGFLSMPWQGQGVETINRSLHVEYPVRQWQSDGRYLVFLDFQGHVCRGIEALDVLVAECNGSPTGRLVGLPPSFVVNPSAPEFAGAFQRMVLFGEVTPGYAHGATGYAVVLDGEVSGKFILTGSWWFTTGGRDPDAARSQRGWMPPGSSPNFERWDRVCRNLDTLPVDFRLKACRWREYRVVLGADAGAPRPATQ